MSELRLRLAVIIIASALLGGIAEHARATPQSVAPTSPELAKQLVDNNCNEGVYPVNEPFYCWVLITNRIASLEKEVAELKKHTRLECLREQSRSSDLAGPDIFQHWVCYVPTEPKP